MFHDLTFHSTRFYSTDFNRYAGKNSVAAYIIDNGVIRNIIYWNAGYDTIRYFHLNGYRPYLSYDWSLDFFNNYCETLIFSAETMNNLSTKGRID